MNSKNCSMEKAVICIYWCATLRGELERSGSSQGKSPIGCNNCLSVRWWRPGPGKTQRASAAATAHWWRQPDNKKIDWFDLITKRLWVTPANLRYGNTDIHLAVGLVWGYRPWGAVLFRRVEVLLHALVVVDLGGDWDRQGLTVVSIAATVVTSRELTGPANNSEKNREYRGKLLDKRWEGLCG